MNDSPIPGPGDGSGWFEPGYFPDENWRDIGTEPPVECADTSPPERRTLLDFGVEVEVAGRREGFTEGPWFLGNDGRSWFLPIIDLDSWRRFDHIRQYFRLNLVEVNRALKAYVPAEPLPECVEILRNLFFEMMLHNYVLTSKELVAIISVETGDGREMEYSPLIPLALYLSDHVELLVACDVAERNGGEPEDVLALNGPCSVLDGPLLGWCNHDGLMFDN